MKYEPKFTITEKMRLSLREIERLRGKISGIRILPEAEATIRQRASVESVHSSTSIEGNPRSVSEVRKVIGTDNGQATDAKKPDAHARRNSKPIRGLTREEYAKIEVKNYKRALDYIDMRRNGEEELKLEDILELHRIITDGLLDETRNGRIRQNMVYIENQRREVLYTAVDAGHVEEELEALLDWVSENKYLLHPVIAAGILHYQLVSIHPFSDGNGRTARAATGLFLALNQYDDDGALSLDSYYATDKRAYYDILARTQGRNFETARVADLTAWLEYFTEGFLSAMHVLDAEIRIMEMAMNGALNDEVFGADLTQVEQEILDYIEKMGSISIAEAEMLMPEVNRRKIQRKLRKLVDERYLEMVGEGREVRYRKVAGK